MKFSITENKKITLCQRQKFDYEKIYIKSIIAWIMNIQKITKVFVFYNRLNEISSAEITVDAKKRDF